MDVFTDPESIPDDFGPSAVTIGKFDGVHVGHHHMIDELLREAKVQTLVPAVLTFDRNPLSLLLPDVCPVALLSNTKKLEILQATGVAATLMLTFDKAFSELSAEDFVRHLLVDTLHAKLVFVGGDFRFGNGGTGTISLLRELGRRHDFEVREFAVEERDGRRVSSTWIRELLLGGDVAEAANLMGRAATVRGVVVPGARRGRELGFPTANLDTNLEGVIPADGVYAAFAIVNGDRYPAAVSIGNNPTFTGVPPKQVEAHLLDTDIDLYGKTLELEFVERIRGMEKFDGIEALIARMTTDVDQARRLLNPASAEPETSSSAIE